MRYKDKSALWLVKFYINEEILIDNGVFMKWGRDWCQKYCEFYKSSKCFSRSKVFSNFSVFTKKTYWFEVLTFNFIPEKLPLPSQFQMLIQEKVQKLIWSLFHFPILSIVESDYWRQKGLTHSLLLNEYPRNRRNMHYL